MTDNEWEEFKKKVKPIKSSGIIKGSSVKKSNKIEKLKIPKKDQSILGIDLEDCPLREFQIDKNTIKRIKKGKINISTTLDLHGYNINQSKEIVVGFIKKNFLINKRLVLIITGKGKSFSVGNGWKADGKLKKSVPLWLSSTYLSKYILWFDTATPEQGGTGALFVYLKKSKNKF